MKLRDAPTVWFSTLVGLATVALAIGCAGCKSSGSAGGPADAGTVATETACDPLAGRPITLGAVVGVGSDAAGTLYVDAASGIFVSQGGQLIRQHLIGFGQSGTSEFLFDFEPPAGDESSARNLLVETQGTSATAMALGSSTSKSFLDQSDAGVTSLTLVDPATVSGLTLVNTPNLIDFVGDVANGDVVLATVPLNDDPSDGGITIFYGPPSAVAQRTVTSFFQSLSSYDGAVTFLVDGTPYVLAIGTASSPDAGPLGGGTLTLEGLTPEGGTQVAVTVRSPTPTALPPNLSFTCLP